MTSTKNNEQDEATNQKLSRAGAHSGHFSVSWQKFRSLSRELAENLVIFRTLVDKKLGKEMPSTRELSNRFGSKVANMLSGIKSIESLLGEEEGFRFNINEFVEELDVVDVQHKKMEFERWIEVLKKAMKVLEEERRKRSAKRRYEQEAEFEDVKQETRRAKRAREREVLKASTKDVVLNKKMKKMNIDS